MRVGIVVPHIFMQVDLLPQVIFAPGELALDLADGLQALGDEVTIYTPGPIPTKVQNVTADLTFFKQELASRDTDYLGLLKSKPLTFITLARQAQAELIAQAYADANDGQLDVVHIYSNEEDLALPYARFCTKPVVFTHHDPFNFTANYKNVFPRYKDLNWLSVSLSQRHTMPADTNWLANIYHGLPVDRFRPLENPEADYLAYLGRIISPKGVHLAIQAVKLYNQTARRKLKLKIAGKHYAEQSKDSYWQTRIVPELSAEIEYLGFIKDDIAKQEFLGNAAGLIIPSTFEEPFGMVMVEALACGIPLLGLDSGAIPEIITRHTGIVVPKIMTVTPGHTHPRVDEAATAQMLAAALPQMLLLRRAACRQDFEERFSLQRMSQTHHAAYQAVAGLTC